MQTWLLTATEKQLLNAAVGNSPSLADVVKWCTQNRVKHGVPHGLHG